MINLLPPQYVDVVKHGKTNEYMARWLVALVVAIIGLLFILASGWLYLDHQTKQLGSQISAGKQKLDQQNITGVRKDAEQISKDVKVINQVLGREIRFSDLIQQIGKVMPPGTILGGLTLTKVDGAIDLTASAKDYNSAAQIAVNLSDPANNLFSKADIVNIKCNSTDTAYKCSANFKALFNKDSQSRFINAPQAGQ